MTTERASGTRRAGWILVDQLASSLTNFALALLVARSVTVEGFGAFSIAFITYLILIEFMRALSLEPLLIRFSGTPRDVWAEATESVLGLAILVGMLALLPLVLLGLTVAGDSSGVPLALAVSLPGLLLQDSCRYAFFARGRPRSAFVNDAAWGLVLVGTVVSLSMIAEPSVGFYVLAWGLTGTLAGTLGTWQLGVGPKFRRVRGWMITNRDIAPRFVVEVLAGTGGYYGVFLLVAAISGLAGVGALYAARVLLAPIGVLFIAATAFTVSEGSRYQDKPAMVARFAHWVGLILPSVALLWTAALQLVPSNIGDALLGDSWQEAKPVLLAFGIFWAADGAIVGARGGLRVFAAARRSLRAQIVTTTLMLTGSTIGAFAAGPSGAALGLAITGILGAAVWWIEFRREARIRVIARSARMQGNA